MARLETDEHFRYFGDSLADLLIKYGEMTEEEILANQQRQFEKLVELETTFRKTLASLPEGQKAFEDFVKYVCDIKRNILIARPYLRERQDIFTSHISPLLKKRDVKGIQDFHFSYRFVAFVVNGPNDSMMKPRDFSKTDIPRLFKEICDIRKEIVETNLPLAINRAGIFWKRTTQVHLQFMDLVQTCVEGLISAVDKFCLPFTPVWRSVAIGRMVGNQIELSSLDQDLILETCDNKQKKIKDFVIGDRILGINDQGEKIETDVKAVFDHGTLPGVELMFDDGYSVTCSLNHKFLTELGQVPTWEILDKGLEVYCEPATSERWMADPLRGDVAVQEGVPSSSEGVREVRGDRPRSEDTEGCCLQGSMEAGGKLESGVRLGVSKQEDTLSAQEGLPTVSGGYSGELRDEGKEVAVGTYRGYAKECRDCQKCVSEETQGRSSVFSGVLSEGARVQREMEEGASRSCCRTYEEGICCSQAVQNGSLVEGEQDIYLGRCPDQMRGVTQASGLCIPRSQGLDRSGRVLSLSGNIEKSSKASNDPVQGQDIEGRSVAPRGRYAYPVVDGVLHFGKEYQTEGRMVDVAFSTSPLSSTGSLVCRKIVQFRSVGLRRMYDLEVSHPKHNFLLPNGVVTSNSDTLLHFFPNDRKKIYRANKALRRLGGNFVGVDFDKLAEKINENMVDQAHAE